MNVSLGSLIVRAILAFDLKAKGVAGLLNLRSIEAALFASVLPPPANRPGALSAYGRRHDDQERTPTD